uniref:Uncharacterized protein n=1 Tax=Romanomermis culicivorax TaxID=13658 RepID=A0A915KHH8_ROMCU
MTRLILKNGFIFGERCSNKAESSKDLAVKGLDFSVNNFNSFSVKAATIKSTNSLARKAIFRDWYDLIR